MTTTTVINGATVGTTAADISNVTKQAITSSAFSIQAALTAGASFNPSKRVTVWFNSSPDDLTANDATARSLQATARRIEIPSPQPSATVRDTTPGVTSRGGFLYVWVQEPLLGAAATLTVKVTEL
jgi:hypothetical protein